MGRYYNGDIEGKFWFAVQSSDVGERFGATPHDSAITSYQVDRGVFERNKTMDHIRKVLGNDLKIFEDFFDENDWYNDEQLLEWFAENGSTFTDNKLSEYADYCFGMKIEKYFNDYPDNDYLWYDAEM